MALAPAAAAPGGAPPRWVPMLVLGRERDELLDGLRGADAGGLRTVLEDRADLLDILWRACTGAAREGDPPNAAESEFCREADMADTAAGGARAKVDGVAVDEGLDEAAKALGRELRLQNCDECAALLSDVHAVHGERLGDTSGWAPADWVRLGADSFFDMRKDLLRLLKALLKCASDDPACRDVLKERGALFSDGERRSDGRLIEPLLAYFGVGTEYRRNKQLRERLTEPRVVDVLHEHRLVAECLFYLARRTDGEWEVEHLCSLAAIIKDLTTSSSDLLEFPKSWTIDEHRTERSEEDVSKKHTAELAHITSVLCVAWWEAVHRTRGRGRGGSRDQDEEKLKALVELARRDDRTQLNGFGLVLDMFLRVGLHQFVTNRTQNDLRYVTDPWGSGAHEQQLREWHRGAFLFLADVLTCMRVKAEADDAVDILRSLQGFMLHLVEKYVRPIILAIGQEDDQPAEPEPEQIRKLEPLLCFWAELCLCMKQSMPPEQQEWLDFQQSSRALANPQMKNFVLWGMEAFLRTDERHAASGQQHAITNACFDPFCTVLGTYSCFEPDVASEVFAHLHDAGWWTQQQRGQHDQGRSVTPVLDTFERLQQAAAQRQQGLPAHQRTFCIAALRLLRNIVTVIGNPNERPLDVPRWLKALVGMISLETEKPPELRVELFRTLTTFVEISGTERIAELLRHIDQVNLLGPQAMPAELNKYEAQKQVFPVVRACLDMIQVVISQREYWVHAVTRPQEDASSPLRLLNFVRDDVLTKHFSGRLYRDSGEKWKMASVAISVLLELVQQPTDPTWMLPELKLVMKTLDSAGLVHVLRFARENHVEGRVFEDAVLVALKFIHRVLELRIDNIDLTGAGHTEAFTYPRVMNLLGLIGYQYSPEIVLASACILTNLSNDTTKLPLASIGLDHSRDDLRRDFHDAVAVNHDGDFRARPSWVVLNLLVRQARQWHAQPDMTKPALVHVMLGWPSNQDLSFGTGPGSRFQFAGYHTGLRVKQDRIAESDHGIIGDVLARLDPESYHPEREGEHWRETELCWELVRLLFGDRRTHHAMRSQLTADENRRFFDGFMDTCLDCWEPFRRSLGSVDAQGEEVDYALSLLYQTAQYMHILAVELNQSAVSPTGFSMVDKLLAAVQPGAGEEDLSVVTAMLETMDLSNKLAQPRALDVDDPEPERLRTFGSRGEELYSVQQLDLWWRRMKEAHSSSAERHAFLSLVLDHNRFRTTLHAGQQNFLSWKRVAELIIRHKWAGPWNHGRSAHENKVRRMLAALLAHLRSWCESVDKAQQLHLLKLVLGPLTELVALCVAQLAEFSQGADNSEEHLSRPDVLEAIVSGILASDHDSAVRGNLYTALLHLLWWCGVGRGRSAAADNVQRAHLSAAQQELLDRVGRVLHAHVGITGSHRRSLLTVISVDAFAGGAIMNAAASLSRPPPWVQTLATSAMELIVRQDWEAEGRWVTRLGEDRLLDQILLPGAHEPQVDLTAEPTPDQAAALHVLEARLTLSASLAEAPPGHDAVGNAVLALLPRLRESWYFVGESYLRDHHKMRLLLDADSSSQAVQRYHRLVVPVLRTYVNLLVSHEDSIYALEQAIEFLVAAKPLIIPVLDAGAAAQGLPSVSSPSYACHFAAAH